MIGLIGMVYMLVLGILKAMGLVSISWHVVLVPLYLLIVVLVGSVVNKWLELH